MYYKTVGKLRLLGLIAPIEKKRKIEEEDFRICKRAKIADVADVADVEEGNYLIVKNI